MLATSFPGGSDGKEFACNVGDLGSIPGSERSLGEGNGLRYSCLENSMDRGAWWVSVQGGHKESDTTKQLMSAEALRHWQTSSLGLSKINVRAGPTGQRRKPCFMGES